MNITTKAQYGLMAMCELGRRYGEGPVSIREIAGLQNTSDSYMEQLFALLKKAALIKSVRGAKGGYILNRAPCDITTGEIIRALEGPLGFAPCADETASKSCEQAGKCCALSFWRELYNTVNDFLEGKTLLDLIQNK